MTNRIQLKLSIDGTFDADSLQEELKEWAAEIPAMSSFNIDAVSLTGLYDEDDYETTHY